MKIRCRCGHVFEAAVDASAPEVAVRCPSCGAALRVVNHKAAAAAMSEPERVAMKLRRCELASGILWLILGVVQVVLVYTAAAGLWNIVNSILRLRSLRNLRAGNPEVVPWYDGRKTMIIIFAVVNIVLGGVVGVALAAFDWWVRDYALKNRAAFVGASGAHTGK